MRRPARATRRNAAGCPPGRRRAAASSSVRPRAPGSGPGTPASSSGRDPALAGLAGDVDLDQHLGLRRPPWRPSWSAPSRWRPSGCSARAAARPDLAALQVADEVPREAAGRRAGLGHQILGAVLPHERHAGLGERPAAPRAGTYLIAARISTSAGSRPAAAISVADRGEVARATSSALQSVISSTTPRPAWRPVTPWSRRWEKNSSGRAERAQADVVARRHPGAARSCCARDRLQIEVAARRAPRPMRRRLVDLLSHLVAARPGARADGRVEIGRRRRARGPHAPRSAIIPAASPRQPAWSIATPPQAGARPAGSRRSDAHRRDAARSVAWPSTRSPPTRSRGSSVAAVIRRTSDPWTWCTKLRPARRPRLERLAVAGHRGGDRRR